MGRARARCRKRVQLYMYHSAWEDQCTTNRPFLTVYIMVECLEGENKIRKEGETGVKRACRQLWELKIQRRKGGRGDTGKRQEQRRDSYGAGSQRWKELRKHHYKDDTLSVNIIIIRYIRAKIEVSQLN